MRIVIKEMEKDDLSQVMEIEKESFSTSWSQNLFLQEIEEEKYSLYLVACKQNQVIGYTGAWIILEELHITNLAVDRSYRRQGIATRLLEELMARAVSHGCDYAVLEVRNSNQAAFCLYQKHGFKKVGFRKNYYQDTGENALIMRKEFTEDGSTKCSNRRKQGKR